MQKPSVTAAFIITIVCSACGGYFVADRQSQEQASADRRENYTDRERICIEAAAMIRNGESEAARKYLEAQGVGAIRGVPMGTPYADLLPKSQTLLVSAKRYDNAFPEAGLEIERLATDVPDDHPEVSSAVRSATTPAL